MLPFCVEYRLKFYKYHDGYRALLIPVKIISTPYRRPVLKLILTKKTAVKTRSSIEKAQ